MKSLEITTKVGCTNKCIYCPQDKLLSVYNGNEYMNIEQFKIILSNTPKDIIIDFTGFCEAFLNPIASWMMRYSFEQGYKIILITTLSGFTEKDAIILKYINFEHVLIHIFEGTTINFDILEAKIMMLRASVLTDKFERFRLDKEHRFSRAGNLWDTEERKGKFECGWYGREFYRNVVLPNGDAYLCCMDYSLKHKLGNLFTTNYKDLNRQSIIDLTDQEESDIICRHCEIMRQ
jgi:radical SAM protein with 4Fe4S-binding SPASM domain